MPLLWHGSPVTASEPPHKPDAPAKEDAIPMRVKLSVFSVVLEEGLLVGPLSLRSIDSCPKEALS